MQENSKRRLTITKYLQHRWMTILNRFDILLIQKRDRLSTSFTSIFTFSNRKSLQKVIRKTFEYFVIIEENLTIEILNVIWWNETCHNQVLCRTSSSFEVNIKDNSSMIERQQLIIQIKENDLLSFIDDNHFEFLILDSSIAQDESSIKSIDNVNSSKASLMHNVAFWLHATLQTKTHDNNRTITSRNANLKIICDDSSWLSIFNIQVRREIKSLVTLKLEFDNEEWTNNFWNEVLFSVNLDIELQSASSANRNSIIANTALKSFSLQVLVSQICCFSFLHENSSSTSLSITSIESDSTWSRDTYRDVIYSKDIDDVTTDISFWILGITIVKVLIRSVLKKNLLRKSLSEHSFLFVINH